MRLDLTGGTPFLIIEADRGHTPETVSLFPEHQTTKEDHKMTTKTTREAWEIAQQMIPEYTKDQRASDRAGYPIYTSPSGEEWIADLSTRLEVNTKDGKSLNIWIDYDCYSDADPEDFVPETIRTDRIARDRMEAEKAAQRLHPLPLYTPEVMIRVTLTVDDPVLSPSDDNRKVWTALRRNPEDHGIVYTLLESYCRDHGIVWGTMTGTRIDYYRHGITGTGHFVVSGYIGASIGQEGKFLGTCSGMLFQAHDDHRSDI